MLKRIVNLTGSMFVRAADWAAEHLGPLLGRPAQPRCVVLAYHSVPAEQRGLFVQQMEMLRKQAKIVHADIQALPQQGGHYVMRTLSTTLCLNSANGECRPPSLSLRNYWDANGIGSIVEERIRLK
jgi:hypothetical protein